MRAGTRRSVRPRELPSFATLRALRGDGARHKGWARRAVASVLSVGDEPVSDEQVEIEPWHAVWSDAGTWPGQPDRLAAIRDRTGATLGDRVFLATDASIACESLTIGDRTYVAKGCVLRDRITMGEDCTPR